MFQMTHSTLPNLTSRLCSTNDPAFPVHSPLPDVFAFANGMLNIRTLEFCSFEQLSSRHPTWGSSGALNFIHEWFDPLWLVQPLDKLAVPGYDDILRTQNYTPDTIALLDAMLGRLFFPVNFTDHLQVMPVLLGIGASGKSTIGKAVTAILGAANVGILPSTGEIVFGLMGLPGKHLLLCTEMKEDFNLPMANLQNMITGEAVPVAVKNQARTQVDAWGMPILLMGNAVPIAFMQDTGGAMERRSVVFRMDVKPASQDPMVALRFMANLGPFLVRCLRRYTELYKLYGVKASEDMAKRFRANCIDRNPQMLAFQAAFKGDTSTSAAFLEALTVDFAVGIHDDLDANAAATGTAPGIVPTDAPLMELFHWMSKATRSSASAAAAGSAAAAAAGSAAAAAVKRFPNLAFTTEAIQLAVNASRLGSTFRPDMYGTLAHDYRVPFKELETIFKQWQAANRLTVNRTGTNQKGAPKFKTVLSELGLPCSTDMDDLNPTTTWVYGIRRTSMGAPRGPDD
jgi:hypothetical protein